jgi:Flp pilus assembly pilin Flp
MLKLFIAIQSKLADARNEEGQTMAEYGVVLAVITAGIIVALGLLSDGISDALDDVRGMLTPG